MIVNEKNAQQRIDEALESIDGRVEMLINRPGMITGTSSFHTAETMLTILLDIRASLVGGDYDYRKYCHEHYPGTPSPVRCIATYLNDKWEGIDPGFGPGYGEKNDEWSEGASKFVDWAMEEMSKMDEKIISEAKFYNPSIEYYVHAKPDKWISFLGEAMDEESQIILQEWFGYCLTNDTSLQKMLLLIGDRGTGKSTVVEVLRRLIQPGLHARTTMKEMGGQFFLQSIIGKTAVFVDFDPFRSTHDRSESGLTLEKLSNMLAEVAEDKVDSDDSASIALHRLISAPSEGDVRIERMKEEAVTRKLDARFIIIQSRYEVEPDWPHEFERRMVRVIFEESEKLKDTDILTDIFKEMPGILNWALEGLVRLRKAGQFTKLKIKAS